MAPGVHLLLPRHGHASSYFSAQQESPLTPTEQRFSVPNFKKILPQNHIMEAPRFSAPGILQYL